MYLVCTQQYITMAESNVEKFLETSDLHYLYQCTKEELCEVGDTHQISLERKLKEEMQKELVEKLGMREAYSAGEMESDDVAENVPENVKNFSESEIFALEKFKIECQMQIQKESIRAEKEIKLKQMEIGSKGVDDDLHRVDV